MAEYMSTVEAGNRIDRQIRENHDKEREVYEQIILLFEESNLPYGNVQRIVGKIQAEMIVVAECATKSMDFAALRKHTLEK